jgi:hypothetical protein
MSDSESVTDSKSSKLNIYEDANELLISLDLCGSCSRNSSPVSELTDDCFSEANSPDTATSRRTPRTRTPGTPESHRSSSTRSSIQESIRSSKSESSESSVEARLACIFMIDTMLRVFHEDDGFFVNDDYDEATFDQNLIEFFVFKNEEGKEGELCLNFYFDPDNIYIERAFTSKCGNVTGTDLLNKMGMVFLLLRDKYPDVKMKIRLDEAELKFLETKRSLSWLYLFRSGESWYNSKGYYEDKNKNKINYKKNSELIREFIEQKVVDVYNKEELDLISLILDDPISDQETIRTLFIQICDILKMKKEEEEEEKEKCCACIGLLNLTIKKFMDFLKTKPGNRFMCTKFYELYYDPGEDIEAYLRPMIEQLPPLEVEEEKGGRKTRKQRVNKRKNTRKRNKKSMKRGKGKKATKRRTKKNKRRRK